MYILIAFIALLAAAGLCAWIYSVFRIKINFFVTGLDSKFSFGDLRLLWNVAVICGLDEPVNLFWSMPSLVKCMERVSQLAGDGGDGKYAKILSKLYDYRTRLQNESDGKKGIDSTSYLSRGQKLRIILPGRGVFTSEILNNGREMSVSVPRKDSVIPVPAEEWVGHDVSVYLWRSGDASYVFDTSVTGAGVFVGKPVITLRQSFELHRTQKRRAVRVKCMINAELFVVRDGENDESAVETRGGYRCRLEDISEAGALVRIGGKGVPNVRIKLQFNIRTMLIVMSGVVRTVEFIGEKGQSLLHFECTHIEPEMRNEVLAFVYKMLPDSDREICDALAMTADDEKSDSAASGPGSAWLSEADGGGAPESGAGSASGETDEINVFLEDGKDADAP